MKAIQMVHTTDPKKTITDQTDKFMESVELLGADVLVGIYIRPEMTAGRIILAANTRKEDEWQGKVGLILAMGPLAFVEDSDHRFGKNPPKVGDWVAFRPGDTWQLSLGEQKCRTIEDVDVKMKLLSPDIVI